MRLATKEATECHLNIRKSPRVIPTKMMRMVDADLVMAVVIDFTCTGNVGIGLGVDGAGVGGLQLSVFYRDN